MFRLSKLLEKLEDKSEAKFKSWFARNKAKLPMRVPAVIVGWYFYGMFLNSLRLGIASTFHQADEEIQSIWVLNPFKNWGAVFTGFGIVTTLVIILIICLITKKGYIWFSGYKYTHDPRGFDILPDGTHGTSGFLTEKEMREFLELSPAGKTEGMILGKVKKHPNDPDAYALYAAHRMVAGDNNNLLCIGAPGSGKTMLARRLPTILPPMTEDEILEITKIYSIAGLLNGKKQLVLERPFRSPHHTVSASALIGGGSVPKPGEVTLSHNGVLFLDELPEFSRQALEVLRQPLEDGQITVSRAAGSATYPSHFQLVAAMNPCKCGWRGHPSGKCTCSDKEVEKYVQKISGPLLDRIDLHVNVPSVEYEAMRRKSKPESSAQVKERVDAARAIQSRRFEGTGIPCNAQMTPPMVGRFCELDSRCDALMKSAFERMGLTARSHDRVLRVARTIADLDGAEHIGVEHLSEAIQYRNTDILKG